MNSSLLDPSVWRRIAPYLDRALDLAPRERDAWLSTLTHTEPEIAGTVRKLLAEYDALTAAGFLQRSPLAIFDFPSMTGKRIGAYTIEHLLGRGGMGEVWLASRHDGRFEGHCAIKFLDDTLARANVADRFRREAHLLARLAHPHIARLIDAGSTDDGRQYLALEYVDGERIDRYCQSKALTVAERVRLFLDVIAAVAHAHTNLIIHRDLKPSNVLVTREGVVKLLDFGIAKLIGDEAVERDRGTTHVEEIALTPDYAAPEQILGDAPSTATDVYQLGMLLYVLLTGSLPVAGPRADLARAVLANELPRASELASGHRQKELRGDLDAILSLALRKNREERYPTAAALGEDLRRYLGGETVSARRGGALYHTRKFVRRHRLAVLATAVAVGSLCAMLVFALAQAREAGRQRDQARLEAKRADAQNGFMKLTMAEVGAPDQPITPKQILENSETLLESHYADDPAFMIDMLIELAGRYMDYGERAREYAVLIKAESIARKQRDPLALANVQCTTVSTEIALGHLDRAAARLAEGQRMLARAANPPLDSEVECLHASAFVSEARGKPMEAIRVIEQGVAVLETRNADHGDIYTSLVSHLSGIYGHVGNIPKAFEAAHKHRMAEQAKYGTDTAGLLIAIHNEACVLYDLGELQAALAEETRVLKRQAASGSPSGILPAVLGTYSTLLIRLDRAEAALPWLEQSLTTATRVGDVVSSSLTRIRRARALHALHRDAEAEAELDAVDRAVTTDAQASKYAAARAALVRAQLFAARGALSEARARVEPVLARARDPGSGFALLLEDALLTASRVALAQGRFAAAESYAREALARSESHARNAAQSADVGEAALVLAQVKLQRDDRAGAGALARRAAISLTSALGATHSLTREAVGLAGRTL